MPKKRPSRTAVRKPHRSPRFLKGARVLARLNPKALLRIEEMMADVAPDMARFIVEFPYGEIYSRKALDLRTRELITVATLTAIGAPEQLRAHIHYALGGGCRREEILEAVMQMAVYAGFPAAINGLFIVRDEFRKLDAR